MQLATHPLQFLLLLIVMVDVPLIQDEVSHHFAPDKEGPAILLLPLCHLHLQLFLHPWQLLQVYKASVSGSFMVGGALTAHYQLYVAPR